MIFDRDLEDAGAEEGEDDDIEELGRGFDYIIVGAGPSELELT